MGDPNELSLDRFLGGEYLNLDEHSIPWILNHIDDFVSQSRGNESVVAVNVTPNAFTPTSLYNEIEVWDKVGQAIGNLQSLERLRISATDIYDGDEEVAEEDLPIHIWEKLSRILSKVRQKVEVNLTDTCHLNQEEDAMEFRMFARAIHGHPTITSFDDGQDFPSESLVALYSALAAMPALESIRLGQRKARSEDESALAHLESLTELLRVPSLRSVEFADFNFPSDLCQATANALMGGTGVTKLEFHDCEFPDGECATNLANSLTRNTSVTSIAAIGSFLDGLSIALALALPSNLTLRDLSFMCYEHDVSPIILALGKNTGLKTVSLDRFAPIDESLCTAMKDGLGMNATLEKVELNNVILRDDNADMWCTAFSFLRINKTLKTLVVDVDYRTTESCVSALRLDIAAMLQDNASLENLSILSDDPFDDSYDYDEFVTVLQHNTTLKTLSVYKDGKFQFNDDADKRFASLLKKNYVLESLPDIASMGDVGAILRLNAAGRRYLVEDGSSISKGVEVLSGVSDGINCVLLHLLENPRLCDRSAVEKVSVGESNGSSTNPTDGSGGGKRERASIDGGKASHRRLA
jgi:hypothetical protein